MTDIAIRVQTLNKRYHIYDTSRDRLKQFVVPKLCRAISKRLTESYGAGFSVANLKNFRQFYLAYTDRAVLICHTSGSQLAASDGLNPKNPLGRHSGAGRNPAIKNTPRSRQKHDVVPLTREFVNHLDTGLRRYNTVFSNGLSGLNPKGYPAGSESPSGFYPNLSWSHYRALMWVKNITARQFYEAETVRSNWSRRDLERQIGNLFYERLLASTDKTAMLEGVRQEVMPLKPLDMLKDSYVLEFLDLPNVPQLQKIQLEQANGRIAALLELGSGFNPEFTGRKNIYMTAAILGLSKGRIDMRSRYAPFPQTCWRNGG